MHPNVINNKKVPRYIFYWLMIHSVCILALLIICSYYKKNIYLEWTGYYQNQQIQVLVEEEFFTLVNNKLKIGDTEYTYQILEIVPMTYENGRAVIWEVKLEIDIPEQWKVDNHVFRLSFEKETVTILRQIIRSLKEGVNL